MKRFLTIIIVVMTVMAAVTMLPASHEISFMHTVDGVDTETVISWDFLGKIADYNDGQNYDRTRHFSIEYYYDNDITSAFIMSFVDRVHTFAGAVESWNVLNIEAWKNVDEAWIDISLGF